MEHVEGQFTGAKGLEIYWQAWRVQVRVDPKLAKALQARARREKRSVSEIARTALREYIERAA